LKEVEEWKIFVNCNFNRKILQEKVKTTIKKKRKRENKEKERNKNSNA
jgi:hypothetical protein